MERIRHTPIRIPVALESAARSAEDASYVLSAWSPCPPCTRAGSAVQGVPVTVMTGNLLEHAAALAANPQSRVP
jgi:hypothetical protein